MRLDAVTVDVRVDDLDGRGPFGGVVLDGRYPAEYPKDFYWVFSGCLEDWGNRHDVCPGDVRLRKGFRGHCVCGHHRVDDRRTP